MILLSFSFVLGSYISFSVTMTSDTLSGDQGSVILELGQRGDETAYKTEVLPFQSDHFYYTGNVRSEELDPGEKLDGHFNFSSREDLLPGAYPFVAQVVYHDANMHPFSLVSPHTIVYQTREEPLVAGLIRDFELGEESITDFALEVRNLEEKSRDVRIRVYLPEEIITDTDSMDISLGPGETKEISFIVQSLGALAGSSYTIAASLEYEDGYHYTSFAGGNVKIIEKEKIIGLSYEWIIAILIVLVILFVVYQIWGVWSERKESS